MNKSTVDLSNGTRIAYLERAGSGVPVILLHGITDNATTYEPLMPEIDLRARVLAMDFRGHGESAKPDSLYDTEAYADDVRHFIREVAGESVILEGHSLGGAVAVQVAVSAPDLVLSILLEDPPLYFVNNLDPIYQTLFESIVTMAKSLQDGSLTPEACFKMMAQAPDPYTGKPGIETMGEDGIRQRIESISSMKPKALEDALAGSLEWDSDAILAQVQCPMDMIVGNPDLGAVITAEEVERAMRIVSDSRVTRLDDVGHLIHFERPEAWLGFVNAQIAQQTER